MLWGLRVERGTSDSLGWPESMSLGLTGLCAGPAFGPTLSTLPEAPMALGSLPLLSAFQKKRLGSISSGVGYQPLSIFFFSLFCLGYKVSAVKAV